MAYSHPGLSRQGSSANSDLPTIWSYKTNDTAIVVEAADYFNAAADDLQVGDAIYAYVDADGTPDALWYYVSSNDGTTVVIATV